MKYNIGNLKVPNVWSDQRVITHKCYVSSDEFLLANSITFKNLLRNSDTSLTTRITS